MVMQLLSNWPLVVLAQALGVGMACGVDAVSWRTRRDKYKVAYVNFIGSCGLLLLIGRNSSALMLAPIATLIEVFAPPLFWLSLVTWTQRKQLVTSLRATFFGVLMQFFYFVGALFCGCLLAFECWQSVSGEIVGVWFLSAILTHLILSLFRPALAATWRTYRRNTRKF